MGFMFRIFPIFFFLPFVLVFGIFLFVIIISIRQWNKDNHAPRLTVSATVVGRRQHRSNRAGDHHHTHTSYYITFQVDSGDRMELHIPVNEFGYIVEGDRGQLTFQGSRFISFQRTLNG